MAIINTYPTNSSVTSSDQYLTYDSDGTVTLTPASNAIPAGTVTSAMMNFGGSGAGIWWEEIGRTTLATTNTTLSLASIPARKYLRVHALLNASATQNTTIRFNNDSAANYAWRWGANGGADTTGASQTSLSAGLTNAAYPIHVWMDIMNVATQEKPVYLLANAMNTAGAANIPGRNIMDGKWANTSAQINQIDFITSTNTYLAGSELVVLGHN